MIEPEARLSVPSSRQGSIDRHGWTLFEPMGVREGYWCLGEVEPLKNSFVSLSSRDKAKRFVDVLAILHGTDTYPLQSAVVRIHY